MKERPIIFSAPMVHAILDGRKTMTRRVVNFGKYRFTDPEKCQIVDGGLYAPSGGFVLGTPTTPYAKSMQDKIIRCPYGIPGDLLWVRENWLECEIRSNKNDTESVFVLYKATNDLRPDGVSCEDFKAGQWIVRPEEEIEIFRHKIEANEVFGAKWRPSIFMPRWASRINLEITNVRVERLQDITDQDALKEGIECVGKTRFDEKLYRNYFLKNNPDRSVRYSFKMLWDSINGKNYPWSSNPWVWVIEFADLHGNAAGRVQDI